MTLSKFHGTGVALVTPFNNDQSVDYAGLKKLLEHTADNGVNYWVVMGTTGESVTMSKAEKKEVLKFIQDNNPKKLPIVYGIGGNNTAELLETIKNTDFQNIDAILSVSPYYNKPSQEGIYQHYVKIADASPVPVILYNVPGRTGSNIQAKTTLRLASHKNIIAVKEASGDLVQCMEIAKAMPADFLLISGDDLITTPMISIGAKGVISVLANAFPKPFTEMVNTALKADYVASSKKLYTFLEINPLMYQESNPVGVKTALEILGVCKGNVRLPLVAASAQLKEQIEKACKGI
jgi:4-hydroxy-tetrahydrodipicolinate synthase